MTKLIGIWRKLTLSEKLIVVQIALAVIALFV